MTKMLDLFAGTGVGVAAKRLGIEEHGVEIMPEAVATRAANGMTTIYNDVWDIHLLPENSDYDILWGSPPCQTFSTAGSGSGSRGLQTVLAAVREGSWQTIAQLRELAAEVGDARTALVLAPLHYVFRLAPRVVVLEQVPAVPPLMAEAVLRSVL